MKKIITTVTLLTFILFAFGQKMDVGSGAYVTQEQGSFITVKGDLVINGTYKIESNSNGTGSLITTGTVSGTPTASTIERYIPGYTKGTSGFHFLSMPVESQDISTEFVDVSSIPTTVDFYYLDEPHYYWINIKDDNGDYNQGSDWSNFSNAANPPFVLGKGYLVGYSTAQTKDFSGKPNSGNKVSGTDIPAITYTSGGGKGYNLLGNPYPSAIDWDNGTWSRTNMSASVYILEASTGNYLSYNGTAGGLTDGVIPAMNGFLVKATSTGASVTIPNASRVHTSTKLYKNSAENILVLEVINDGLSDRLYFQFDENATLACDQEFDAYKLFGYGDSPQIYSKSEDDEMLSINALPLVDEEMVVPVNLKILNPGEHQIAIVENTLIGDVSVFLEDKLLNLFIDLKLNGSYVFNSEIDDDENRFNLHFKESVGIHEANLQEQIHFYVCNNQLYFVDKEIQNATVSMYNMLGQAVMTKQIMDNNASINLDLPSAYYIVNLRTDEYSVNGKVFVK